MIGLKLILLISAFLVFVLAALGVSSTRIKLEALGLALAVLAQIVP